MEKLKSELRNVIYCYIINYVCKHQNNVCLRSTRGPTHINSLLLLMGVFFGREVHN